MEGSRIARPTKRSLEDLDDDQNTSSRETLAVGTGDRFTIKVQKTEEPVVVQKLNAEQLLLMEENTVQLPCFEKTNGKQKIAFKIDNRTFLKEPAIHAIKSPSKDTLLLLSLYFSTRWSGVKYITFVDLHDFYEKFLRCVSPHSRCEDYPEVMTHILRLALETKDIFIRSNGVKMAKNTAKMFYEIIIHPEDSVTQDTTLGVLKGKMVMCAFGKHYIKKSFNF